MNLELKNKRLEKSNILWDFYAIELENLVIYIYTIYVYQLIE